MRSRILAVTGLLGLCVHTNCGLVAQAPLPSEPSQGPLDCANAQTNCGLPLAKLVFQRTRQQLSELSEDAVWQRTAFSSWGDGKQAYAGLFVKAERSATLFHYRWNGGTPDKRAFGTGAPFKIAMDQGELSFDVLNFGLGTSGPLFSDATKSLAPDVTVLIKSNVSKKYWLLFVPLPDFSSPSKLLGAYYRARLPSSLKEGMVTTGVLVPGKSQLLFSAIVNNLPTLFDYSAVENKDPDGTRELPEVAGQPLPPLAPGNQEVSLQLVDLDQDGAVEWVVYDEEAGVFQISSMLQTMSVGKGSRLLGFADLNSDGIKDAVFQSRDAGRIEALTLRREQLSFSGAFFSALLPAAQTAALVELSVPGPGAAPQLLLLAQDVTATPQLLTPRMQGIQLLLERTAEIVVTEQPGEPSRPSIAGIRPAILTADLNNDKLPELIIGRGTEVQILFQQPQTPDVGQQ